MAQRQTSRANGSHSAQHPGKSGTSSSSANPPTPTASPNSTGSSAPRSAASTSAAKPSSKLLWPWLSVAGGLAVLGVIGVGAYAYTAQASGIVRAVTIGGQDVGSLTTLKALQETERAWKNFSASSFKFTFEGKTYNVPLSDVAASEEEVVLEVASFDAEGSVNAAYDFGHRGPWWEQAWARLSGYLGRRHEFGKFAFAPQTIEGVLDDQLAEYNKPAVDAGIRLEGDGVTVTPSATGKNVDLATALRSAKKRLVTFNPAPIALVIVEIQPDVTSSEQLATLAEAEIPEVLKRAPFILTQAEKTWTIDEQKLRELVGFEKVNQDITIGLDRAKTLAYLETLRKDIDIEARDAKFSITNGRVQEFQTSVVGRALDADATLARLRQSVRTDVEKTEAVVTETKPLTDTVATNDLGITELVAEARTNFRGSPPNRVYNLSFGAQKLHGLLIKPGEVFSLVHALGPIDGKNGWKPELVIKGVKITPEYGGGLCQVATTLFRSALNAGLPIVERTNHSLRISYYEPPIGLDATIYEPKPDLKFSNDYPNPLLLQTRIEGTELIFSFFGTKDTRVVDLPEPKVFNKTGIPPTKNIEVTDLKPGEKECQAPGHPGADAIATYTVTKADGTKIVQEFRSHYRPIPVICRVGKKV